MSYLVAIGGINDAFLYACRFDVDQACHSKPAICNAHLTVHSHHYTEYFLKLNCVQQRAQSSSFV